MRNALSRLIPVFRAEAGGIKNTTLIACDCFVVELYAMKAVSALRLNIAAEKHDNNHPFVFLSGNGECAIIESISQLIPTDNKKMPKSPASGKSNGLTNHCYRIKLAQGNIKSEYRTADGRAGVSGV